MSIASFVLQCGKDKQHTQDWWQITHHICFSCMLLCCRNTEILVSFSSAYVLWCSSRYSWFGEFLRRQKGIWCLFAWYLRGWSWDGGLSIGRVPAMSCLQATLLRFCRLLQERGTSVLYERTSDSMDRIHIWIHDQRISERYCPFVQSEAACDFKVSFKCRLEVWGFESGPTAVWTPGGSSQTVHLSDWIICNQYIMYVYIYNIIYVTIYVYMYHIQSVSITLNKNIPLVQTCDAQVSTLCGATSAVGRKSNAVRGAFSVFLASH